MAIAPENAMRCLCGGFVLPWNNSDMFIGLCQSCNVRRIARESFERAAEEYLRKMAGNPGAKL